MRMSVFFIDCFVNCINLSGWTLKMAYAVIYVVSVGKYKYKKSMGKKSAFIVWGGRFSAFPLFLFSGFEELKRRVISLFLDSAFLRNDVKSEGKKRKATFLPHRKSVA